MRSSGSGSAGAHCPARIASSWAATAMPTNSAMDVRYAHTSSARTPVSGPYVDPNDELRATYSDSSSVNSSHSASDTPAPTASHDRPGWLRRGARSKMTVYEPSASSRPSGQRTTFQIAVAASPQPNVLTIAAPTAPPATRTMNPSNERMPAVTPSAAARPYFSFVGRSRSMP